MNTSLASSVLLFVVTVSPLIMFAAIVWQWQKELNQAARLRRSKTMSDRN
ncbi:MAG: hypothetical protein KGL02_07225 [Acidobacteriota bacterium]|nr:hypothetical protein [Acidobacteriota bacterium]MDE3170471.1 hypothetical protein [Acidobacteriota bacterium]